MIRIIQKFFDTGRMTKLDNINGEIPSTKEIYTNIWEIAMPSVFEMVFVSLIGSMDTIMVGVLGSSAIAATGLTGQPRMIILSVFFALNVGVTAVVARRKGENQAESAMACLRSSLMVILILSFFVMGLAYYFAEPMMRIAGGNEANAYEARVLKDSTTYFKIMALSLPIQGLTMCINAAQRGVGNTKIIMVVNIISNVVNVILNYLLIDGNFGFPRLEVAGAAIASVIGIAVGFLLSLYSISGKKHKDAFLHLRLKDDWHIRKEPLRAVSKVGVGAMLEQIAFRTGFFIYTRMVFDLGAEAFASHQICSQFMTISFTVGDGIGVAGTTLVGQMLGKKRKELAVIYGKASQRIALVAALTLSSLIIPFREPLVWLFVNADEPHIAELAAQVMLILACFLPFQTSSVVVSGCLRGAGDIKFVGAISTICVMIIRPLLTALAVYILGLGLIGAWCASLIDMIIRVTCVYTRFHKEKWTSILI